MEEVADILASFINGSCLPEECFCMVVSLLGEQQTKCRFDSILTMAGLRAGTVLHKHLTDVFVQYFYHSDKPNVQKLDSPPTVECLGDDTELELALALSANEKSVADLNLSSASGQSPQPVGRNTARQHRVDTLMLTKETSQGSGKMRLPRYPPLTAKEVHSISKESSHRETASRNTVAFTDPTSKGRKKKRSRQVTVARHITSKPVIYWLRRDLRLHDNPALVAASESNAPIILAYFWNEEEEGPLAAGGASKYWLHFALKEFNNNVQEMYNNQLVFRKVDSSMKEMRSLVLEVGAGMVVMNNLYEPGLKARDDNISEMLEMQGVEVKRFHSYLLHEPGSIKTESVGMRGIGSVTHFMECCRQSCTQSIGTPVDKPSCLPASGCFPQSQALEELGLAWLPRRKDGTVIDWAHGIRESWDFSEEGAWKALELFVGEGIQKYEKESSRVDALNTSRISPYLHFGQISPCAVLRHTQGLKSPKFLRKLAWRDLSYWLLTLFPDLPSRPIRPHYQALRWSGNKQQLRAWQRGLTGFPLVDAAMRQLWLTGWMNNYARHVTASFLISYLHLSWEHGYAWFQDTLVDADVAINAMMWQNGGMSGLDQWNFVMHPVDAALTCDPAGHYVRRWCPELEALPDDFIHKPWKCPPSVLRRAGVELGKTYPQRIITDLEEAREQSLRDVVTLRLANLQFVDPYTGNDLVPLPSGLLLPVITRKEFKHKTANPETVDNPHSAVLRGYRSRKRDEAIAFANQVDFTASTMNEFALRQKRLERDNWFVHL